jgi:hypothetical protein
MCAWAVTSFTSLMEQLRCEFTADILCKPQPALAKRFMARGVDSM